MNGLSTLNTLGGMGNKHEEKESIMVVRPWAQEMEMSDTALAPSVLSVNRSE